MTRRERRLSRRTSSMRRSRLSIVDGGRLSGGAFGHRADHGHRIGDAPLRCGHTALATPISRGCLRPGGRPDRPQLARTVEPRRVSDHGLRRRDLTQRRDLLGIDDLARVDSPDGFERRSRGHPVHAKWGSERDRARLRISGARSVHPWVTALRALSSPRGWFRPRHDR